MALLEELEAALSDSASSSQESKAVNAVNQDAVGDTDSKVKQPRKTNAKSKSTTTSTLKDSASDGYSGSKDDVYAAVYEDAGSNVDLEADTGKASDVDADASAGASSVVGGAASTRTRARVKARVSKNKSKTGASDVGTLGREGVSAGAGDGARAGASAHAGAGVSDDAVAVEMGAELKDEQSDNSHEVLFGSLSRSGIGISKALLQGSRLQSLKKNVTTSDNPFLNVDPRSLLADKITHISGKTLDLGALIHDLKELDPDIVKAANQEGLSGFAGAANDLLLFRKLEELGANQFCNLTISQIRSLIKKSIPKLSDKVILECYQCFKSCIKNGELERKVQYLADKYQVTIPHQSIEAFLFTDDSDYQGSEGLIAIRKLVVETYCNYEDEILKLVKIFDIKNTQFSKAFDEVTFYQYLIARKSGKEHDFRVYEALVKLKNHIELFILMRGGFIKTQDFAIFSDSELVSDIYDDDSIFQQHSYHSAKELVQLEPCGMHFCYLESVLNLIVSTDSARDLLLNFIKKFGQIYINKACSKFFNPTMGFEFDFVPCLLSYVQGLYACQIGSNAFYEASHKVDDLEEAPLFFYELFLNNENTANTPEYQIALNKFKEVMPEHISSHQFTDEMKEWATHIYHQESIYRATKAMIGSIVTCGHPISKDENYLNEQVAFEMMAFYSKYLINLERKKLYAQFEQEKHDGAQGSAEPEGNSADTGAGAGAAGAASAMQGSSDGGHDSASEHGLGPGHGHGHDHDQGQGQGQEHSPSNSSNEEYDSEFWLLGDNGFVPLIPGMPALSAFLIGRAFTYGELMREQNNTWGFSALTYADYSGNYLASTYLAHYYQALFDSKLNAQGQLFFLYHMRAILAFHLGMTSIEVPYSSLKLYHNYDFHISHKDIELYFNALKEQDDSWARLFKKNPTLTHNSRFEGRQPLLSTVFGTIVGNSLIYLCDLIEQNPKFGDFYHNSLLLLINLLERCLKAEYNPVGCFAIYRLLKANLTGTTYGLQESCFEKYFPHSSASALLFHQLFPNSVKSSNFDDLIGQDFNSDDIGNMFLQVGMLSSAHREQGYNLLNHHLSSYKGNFAPLTEPYLDELYRTSAGLGNGNSLSYLSESAHCLNQEEDSELYALMGARIQAGHLYKKLSHYFIKNDMKTERRRLAHQMFFMHRPYGFYDSYLVLKDRKDRVNEAHTFLFYAACMSVPEAISDLEALEQAHLFEPLPFVVYLKYLEQLAKTKVEALLTLRLLSQSGGILPVNSFYFMKFLEHNHAFFSNSMLKKALLDSGQIDLALGSDLYSLQSSSCSELFKDEQEYLRLNSYDMEGNFATYHQLFERDFNVEHFNAHNIGDTVVQETVTKMFDSLVAGKTQLERAIFLNWRMADNFPSYLQEKAEALSISVESDKDFATIDSVMAAYRGALDTYPLSLNISLCTGKKDAHILDSNKSIESVVNSLVKSEIIGSTLETMYAFALNALRGRGRPSPQHFLNFCRYLANTGDASAMRYSHICMDPLNVVPYGQTFNEHVVEAYEKDVANWSKYFAKKSFDGQLLDHIVESATARKERDIILKALDQSGLNNGSALAVGDDNTQGYGSDLNSIIYSDVNRDYLKLSVDSYQELIKYYQRQETQINNLIAQDCQDDANVFVGNYIKQLHKLNEDYWLQQSKEQTANFANNEDEGLSLEVFGPTATFILQSNRFSPTQLVDLIEPTLGPNQKIKLSAEVKGKLYIKSFLDFVYFMKIRGWNIVQSLVCSRNGWQLNRKANGPERSFASLLAKDMLTGAPGAKERFLYYVQSHGFKYHLNSAYFKENDSSQTARNFVTDVLQIDLKSPKFEEFSQSMDSEGFPEFKALLLEETNGYIASRPRLSIDGFEYNAQSGYSSLVDDLAPDLVLNESEAIKARDELKLIAATLNDLATQDCASKSHYFTCADRLMDQNYGSSSIVTRAMIERIVGIENIERLNNNDKPYLSYTFYSDKSIGAHDMLKMLGVSCSILPYRLMSGIDPKSRHLILKNSLQLGSEAVDLNTSQLYGIDKDTSISRWHMSKEQLLCHNANDTSFDHAKLHDSLYSSYSNALYQEDRLCVSLAMLYDQGQGQNNKASKETANANQVAADSGAYEPATKSSNSQMSHGSHAAFKRQQAKSQAWSNDISFNAHERLEQVLSEDVGLQSDDIADELAKYVEASTANVAFANHDGAKGTSASARTGARTGVSASTRVGSTSSAINSARASDSERASDSASVSEHLDGIHALINDREILEHDRESSLDGQDVDARQRVANSKLSSEEKKLLECILSHKEYHGSLLSRRYAVHAKQVLEQAHIVNEKYSSQAAMLVRDSKDQDGMLIAERIKNSKGQTYQERAWDLLSNQNEGDGKARAPYSDEVTSERSLDESMIYDRLKTFLGSNLSFGYDSKDLDKVTGLADTQDNSKDSDLNEAQRRLHQAIKDPSSLLGMIFSRVWEFDESKEEQYTRPHMFYEDENPLHVYIYLLLNIINAHENYEVRLVNEEGYLDALYSQGYFYGCSDLIDCAFKHTVYESYRYRFERELVSKEVSASISNLAGSILERILSQNDLAIFYKADLNEVNSQTQKIAEHFKMPKTTPKRYLLEALINYSDEQVTKRSRYYKALISANTDQLEAHNYEVMLDDSLQHQAFYDLFNCQAMLSCAPNVMHWLYQHNFKGMDIGTIDPNAFIWSQESSYTKELAKSIQGDNHINTCSEQVQIATGLLVDSPELGYQNVKLAKFHSTLTKEQDCRRLSYIEKTHGIGVNYEHLDKAQHNQLDALTLKFIRMQDVLQVAISSQHHEVMPFAPEYIYAGLIIGDDRPWSGKYEEQSNHLAKQCSLLYGYDPIRGTTLGSYRASVAFDEEDRAFYEQYFADNPLESKTSDKDLVDKLIFAGRHKDAFAIHNLLLDQLESEQSPTDLNHIGELDERLAAYEYAQILGLKYFVYDADNYSDIMSNVIISNVCPPKDIPLEDSSLQEANHCSLIHKSAGMYVPVDNDLQEDEDSYDYEELYGEWDQELESNPTQEELAIEYEQYANDPQVEPLDNSLDSQSAQVQDLSGIYLTTDVQGKASNYQDGLAQEKEDCEKQSRNKYGSSPLRDPQDEGQIDDLLNNSFCNCYDNYGDCYEDVGSFEKKTPNENSSKKKKASKNASAKIKIEPYERMSLEELLREMPESYESIDDSNDDEYQDSWDEEENDDPMIMSYDQMETFSKFLAEQNINPMDIEGIADALVKNHFDILDQKGLSHDDIVRTISENNFNFDELDALKEIDQQSSLRSSQKQITSDDTKDKSSVSQLELAHHEAQKDKEQDVLIGENHNSAPKAKTKGKTKVKAKPKADPQV